MQQKSIQLRFRQGIGAGLLQRVLRRHHHEQRWQRARHATHRDLMFLHRFQQRGLHLGRRAVDFVGEDDFVEQRPLDEFELAFVIDVGSGQIARQQVRRELDAPKAAVDGSGQCFHRGCLGQPWQALHQHMAISQQANHQTVEQGGLADNDARQRLAQFKDAGLIRHGNSSR